MTKDQINPSWKTLYWISGQYFSGLSRTGKTKKRTNCHRSESLGKGGQLNATWYFGLDPEQREDIKNL